VLLNMAISNVLLSAQHGHLESKTILGVGRHARLASIQAGDPQGANQQLQLRSC
jgi:hypothetical protein